MQDILRHHWHHLSETDTARLLDTDASRGLDRFEVRRRFERFGPNRLSPRPPKSPWLRFLLQFHHPLVYILLGAALLKLILGGWLDAGVIFGVVAVNALVGFLQESKAASAIEALAKNLVTETTVIRAGESRRIPSEELVVGDLVQIASGDRVPADLRLAWTRDLRVAEAALTGESEPVSKTADRTLSPDTPLADRTNMAYASTLVTYGQARGVVIATADATEIGRISDLIASSPTLETPLTRKMALFGRRLLYVILVLAALVAVLGWVRGQELDAIVSSAIALAVGSIPE
ncbi:MAG: cation-transporting P-type ATPase, partial [Verrucomicrobiales bacterium]|nr:cation-transporting P-type ATPase [Verrucomicrobiales bacterium]